MKHLKLYLALVLIVFMAFGCSKIPTETENDKAALINNQAAAFSIATNSGSMFDFAGGFNSGLTGWTPDTSPTKAVKAPPDTLWIGPTTYNNYYNNTSTPGWYYYKFSVSDTLSTNAGRIWVKFTNDCWATPTQLPVTRVHWSFDDTVTSNNGTLYLRYAAYQSYVSLTDTIHFNGGWHYTPTIVGVTLSWDFSWSDVSRYGWNTYPRTCSGTFNYAGEFGVTATFTFTNGNGTGSASYNSAVFADFVFNSDTTGYYTVTGDTTKHNFTW